MTVTNVCIYHAAIADPGNEIFRKGVDLIESIIEVNHCLVVTAQGILFTTFTVCQYVLCAFRTFCMIFIILLLSIAQADDNLTVSGVVRRIEKVSRCKGDSFASILTNYS